MVGTGKGGSWEVQAASISVVPANRQTSTAFLIRTGTVLCSLNMSSQFSVSTRRCQLQARPT
jgi:hypothetical protein